MTDQKLKGARENRVNRRTQKLYLIFCKNDATFIRGIRYCFLGRAGNLFVKILSEDVLTQPVDDGLRVRPFETFALNHIKNKCYRGFGKMQCILVDRPTLGFSRMGISIIDQNASHLLKPR